MATHPERWIARPVEVEAVIWTGDFHRLPFSWQSHPLIQWDSNWLTLSVTTIEGDYGTPDIGDYLVFGAASEMYWSPPNIHTDRHKHVGGIRWVALPVETEAVLWTGVFEDLPDAWQEHPAFEMDSAGLALTNYRGAITHPRPDLDYIVQRSGAKFSKVPRAIWEYKYQQVGQ